MSKRAKYEKLLNNKNIVAALHTIASVESKLGPEGYGMLVGGSIITPGTNHPAILVPSSNSDAAGRYQFLSTTWARINDEIGPLDFSNPRHQDIAGIWLIELRGVLEDVLKGDIVTAMTGGHDPNLKQNPDRVCERNKSGMGCEWAGIYPNRYGQADHPLDFFKESFDKFKSMALTGMGAPTDDTTDLSSFSSTNTPGNGSQTAMQAFQASLKYGPSSIVGFLGDTTRNVLCHNLRLCKIEGGHTPSDVKKVMGGEGSMAGFVPGMNTTSSTTSSSSTTLQTGKFTPRPGAYINPLPGSQFTSPLGWRWGRMHNGVDLSTGREDAPVLASGDGEVIDVQEGCGIGDRRCGGGFGNLIIIKHPDGMETTYAHLLTGSVKVRIGQKVKQGDIIGIEGTTGGSTGIHLHFETRKDGVVLDPETIVPDLRG